MTAPWVIKVPYFELCFLLDVVSEGRNTFGRFFLLETVARMPYFAHITMLHLYETLGFWRRSADIKRIHFAKECPLRGPALGPGVLYRPLPPVDGLAQPQLLRHPKRSGIKVVDFGSS